MHKSEKENQMSSCCPKYDCAISSLRTCSISFAYKTLSLLLFLPGQCLPAISSTSFFVRSVWMHSIKCNLSLFRNVSISVYLSFMPLCIEIQLCARFCAEHFVHVLTGNLQLRFIVLS